MGTLLDLAAFCQREKSVVERIASAKAVEVAQAILQDFIIVSPVDTSLLVSNWIVTLGAPAVEAIGAYEAGKKGSTRQESSAAALLEGTEVLSQKEPGVPIYITNNVPYAIFINDGTPYIAAVDYYARAALIARSLGVAL